MTRMSVYNALIMLVVLVKVMGLHAVDTGVLNGLPILPGVVDWQPDCEDILIEPVDTNVKDGFVDNKNYWFKSGEELEHKIWSGQKNKRKFASYLACKYHRDFHH